MRACLAVAIGILLLTGCASSPPPHPIVAAAAPADETRAQTERASEGREDSARVNRQTYRALGWATFAVGAEATTAAIVTSFIMLHENALRNDNCTNKVCSSAGLGANASIGQLAGWNTALWALGVGALGAGVVILVINPSDKGVHAQVGATPSGLLLGGSF